MNLALWGRPEVWGFVGLHVAASCSPLNLKPLFELADLDRLPEKQQPPEAVEEEGKEDVMAIPKRAA